MKKTLIAIGLAAALVLTTGTALAGDKTETVHVTYEVPAVQTGVRLEDSSEDLTGLTSDGSIDLQGTEFFCPKDHHEEGATFPDWARSGCGYVSAQVAVVDDVWGAGVVGFTLTTDFNDNHIAGEEDQGETNADFCGSSPAVELKPMPEAGTGGIAIFLNGATEQALNCDVVAAPTATTGGLLDPAAGIFVTFGLAHE